MNIVEEIEQIEKAICQGHATVEQLMRIVQIAREGVTVAPAGFEFIDLGTCLDPVAPESGAI